MLWILGFVGPIAAGAVCWLIAGRCRGRNARSAFRCFSWGFWLLLLRYLTPVTWLFWPLSIALAVVSFWLGANNLLKEMRAQQRGEFTDVV
jgi:hypothetical protein